MAIAQAQHMAVRAAQAAGMQRQQHVPCAAALRAAIPAQAAVAVRLAAAAAVRRAAGGSARRRSSVEAAAVAAHTATESLTIQPVRVIEGHVKLPGSKSLSNRILLLAALAEGTTTVENILVRARVAEVAAWRGGEGALPSTPPSDAVLCVML